VPLELNVRRPGQIRPPARSAVSAIRGDQGVRPRPPPGWPPAGSRRSISAHRSAAPATLDQPVTEVRPGRPYDAQHRPTEDRIVTEPEQGSPGSVVRRPPRARTPSRSAPVISAEAGSTSRFFGLKSLCTRADTVNPRRGEILRTVHDGVQRHDPDPGVSPHVLDVLVEPLGQPAGHRTARSPTPGQRTPRTSRTASRPGRTSNSPSCSPTRWPLRLPRGPPGISPGSPRAAARSVHREDPRPIPPASRRAPAAPAKSPTDESHQGDIHGGPSGDGAHTTAVRRLPPRGAHGIRLTAVTHPSMAQRWQRSPRTRPSRDPATPRRQPGSPRKSFSLPQLSKA